MSDKKYVHIIAFDIPYPPNYGGVIDVWHKIRTFHKSGIKIYLHCFEYPGRERQNKLNEYCEEVHYYPRQQGLKQALSLKPYIVTTRKNTHLVTRLLQDNHPILFEGLHSCYYITNPGLKERRLIYRESNIEHRYYFNLFKNTSNFYLKTYYLVECIKLKFFERKLRYADKAAVVSKADRDELQSRYPDLPVHWIPSFHANDELTSRPGRGEYVLYHGNLEVPENEKAALFLINEVFAGYPRRLVIAGMNPNSRLIKAVKKHDNIELIANPGQEKMDQLIEEAHVNLLITFQATGLKLKLLNALYRGRFALVNHLMVRGTYLDELCRIANTAQEIRTQLNELFEKPFSEENLTARHKKLKELYSNSGNAEKLIHLLYD